MKDKDQDKKLNKFKDLPVPQGNNAPQPETSTPDAVEQPAPKKKSPLNTFGAHQAPPKEVHAYIQKIFRKSDEDYDEKEGYRLPNGGGLSLLVDKEGEISLKLLTNHFDVKALEAMIKALADKIDEFDEPRKVVLSGSPKGIAYMEKMCQKYGLEIVPKEKENKQESKEKPSEPTKMEIPADNRQPADSRPAIRPRG
jgi:hypothetical protein